MSDALPSAVSSQPRTIQEARKGFSTRLQIRLTLPQSVTGPRTWAENDCPPKGREITHDLRRQIDNDARTDRERWQKFKRLTNASPGAPWPMRNSSSRADTVSKLAEICRTSRRAGSRGFARLAGSKPRWTPSSAAIRPRSPTAARDSELVAARSAREHRSTLLHYVRRMASRTSARRRPRTLSRSRSCC